MADPARREPDARVIGSLRVRIDRTLCVGFGDCVKAAPDAFALDEDDVAIFVAPETIERAVLLDACAACPVDAITVWDAEGNQIIP